MYRALDFFDNTCHICTGRPGSVWEPACILQCGHSVYANRPPPPARRKPQPRKTGDKDGRSLRSVELWLPVHDPQAAATQHARL